MSVRGAPAIAIAGMLSLAVELAGKQGAFPSGQEAADYITKRLDYLVTR
jgi:methylthioribose-1-phosphate isomerase